MEPQIRLTLLLISLIPLMGMSAPYPFKELKELPALDQEHTYGEKIQRTMHLLESSTKANPNKVKIVFFGQSITRQDFSRKIIEASLRTRFPHAELEVLNTAIGGYQAPRSVQVMHHTLIPHQPDLVVFHIYGGEKDGSYEQILRNIRNQTTAELICVTHHLDNYNDSVTQQRESASQLRKELADKYGAELIDVRKDWKTYLDMHGLTPKDLLRDNIHHNTHGGELWGALQERHFRVRTPDPQDWQNRVNTIDLTERDSVNADGQISFSKEGWEPTRHGLKSTKHGSPLIIEFEGTRIDIISHSGNGEADILIDEQPPSAHLETWSTTLPTSTPIDYRPAIMNVRLRGKPMTESWTLTVDSADAKGQSFTYFLNGTQSGRQGKGSHKSSFVSENEIIRIDPASFTLAHAIQIKKKPLPIPFDVTWKVQNRSLDRLETTNHRTRSGQATLVQQLPNNRHTMKIIPRKGIIHLEKIIIHRPDGSEY